MEKLSISQVSRSFLYQVWNRSADNLIGRILTLTDAIAKDEVQRKALKDLVQQSVWNTMHEAERELCRFCDDLRDELKEKPDPLAADNAQSPVRVSIFE